VRRHFLDPTTLTNTFKTHYKGTQNAKPRQLLNNAIQSPKQSCKTYFFASLVIGVQGKACVVCRERRGKRRFFLEYFSFNSSDDTFCQFFLSCLVSLECTLGGLFLAHAAAGLHCTVQSITPPWARCSGHMHLNHLGACAAQTHVCPSSTI